MLREYELEVGGFEMVAEFEDVGKGDGGHAEEDVLHVDDKEGCSHDIQKLDERETRTCVCVFLLGGIDLGLSPSAARLCPVKV